MIYLSDLKFVTAFKEELSRIRRQTFTGYFLANKAVFIEFNILLRKEKRNAEYQNPNKQFYQ